MPALNYYKEANTAVMVTLLIVLYHENRLNMIINVNPINTTPDPCSYRKISVLLYYRGCERHIVISSRGRPMHIIVCLMICDMEIVKLEITSRRLPVPVSSPLPSQTQPETEVAILTHTSQLILVACFMLQY